MSPPRCRLWLAPSLLLWSAVARGADPPPVVQITTLTNVPGLLGPLHQELGRTSRFRVIPLSALMPLLRQHDEHGKVLARGRALVEQGRAAVVSLDNERARELLSRALSTLEGGFVRYYEPAELAQAYVLRAVAAVQSARPDLARRDFVAALHHDGLLKLGPYYSPQVRAAFAEASQGLPPRPPPSADELQRLTGLARSRFAVVISGEQSSDAGQLMIKAALFESSLRRYTDVESALVETADSGAGRQQVRELGRKVRDVVARRFPVELGLPVRPTKPPLLPPLIPPPPVKKRWYRRWYTWAAAGAALAACAIAVPLALRREHVDLSVKWPVGK